jgi:hypothetical protein
MKAYGTWEKNPDILDPNSYVKVNGQFNVVAVALPSRKEHFLSIRQET